jgi:hypothetical protein
MITTAPLAGIEAVACRNVWQVTPDQPGATGGSYLAGAGGTDKRKVTLAKSPAASINIYCSYGLSVSLGYPL